MPESSLRNESTDDGKRIWRDVDLAASRAPEWLVERMKRIAESEVTPGRENAKKSESHGDKA